MPADDATRHLVAYGLMLLLAAGLLWAWLHVTRDRRARRREGRLGRLSDAEVAARDAAWADLVHPPPADPDARG